MVQPRFSDTCTASRRRERIETFIVLLSGSELVLGGHCEGSKIVEEEVMLLGKGKVNYEEG